MLPADLVVDASGRAAPTLALIEAPGWQKPQEIEIGVDLAYAQRFSSGPKVPHATGSAFIFRLGRTNLAQD
jgi:hypothetical protein